MSEIIGVIYHDDYLVHTDPNHPERKERLDHIIARLNDDHIKTMFSFIKPVSADIETVSLVHGKDYIDSIRIACEKNTGFLDMDTYIVPQSYEIALRSAGGAVTGLDYIMNGNYRKVFCLIRPPGHHAEANQAMGFCIFNNIAIAARIAQKKYGLERVAIIDWDVHHGNGTQHTFSEDKNVIFLSVHQSPAYPGTGSVRETGIGKGEGYTINIPLPGGCGDDDYSAVFKEIIVPVLKEYRPEILMVSAGQDAYHLDPLAGMNLTWKGYFNMASILRDLAEELCDGRMLVCMEGGYHLEGQAGAVIHAMNAMGSWNLAVPDEGVKGYDGEMVSRRIKEVKDTHKKFWSSFKK